MVERERGGSQQRAVRRAPHSGRGRAKRTGKLRVVVSSSSGSGTRAVTETDELLLGDRGVAAGQNCREFPLMHRDKWLSTETNWAKSDKMFLAGEVVLYRQTIVKYTIFSCAHTQLFNVKYSYMEKKVLKT